MWRMLPLLAQRGVQRVDRGAGHAEHLVHAFLFHHQHAACAAVILAIMSPKV
jgi:hypothetical protein